MLKCVFSDLADASSTHNAPCNPRTVCPNAFVQNLAGCDAGTGECVCQRGYDFDGGLCHGNRRSSVLDLSIYDLVSMAMATDARSRGHGIGSQPLNFYIMTLGKLFTQHTRASINKQHNSILFKTQRCSAA